MNLAVSTLTFQGLFHGLALHAYQSLKLFRNGICILRFPLVDIFASLVIACFFSIINLTFGSKFHVDVRHQVIERTLPRVFVFLAVDVDFDRRVPRNTIRRAEILFIPAVHIRNKDRAVRSFRQSIPVRFHFGAMTAPRLIEFNHPILPRCHELVEGFFIQFLSSLDIMERKDAANSKGKELHLVKNILNAIARGYDNCNKDNRCNR